MMRWVAGAALFAVAALAVWYAFQSPAFVSGLLGVALLAAYKAIQPVLLKRMTPAQEADLQRATRRAQEWDNFRKKPRDR